VTSGTSVRLFDLYRLDLILIRVLRQPSFPQDPTRDLRQDAPLETAGNRSVPMACGPNVDQPGSMGSGSTWSRPSAAPVLHDQSPIGRLGHGEPGYDGDSWSPLSL